MASLKEIAQVSYDQLFPNAGDEGAITREHVLSTAKGEFAYQSLLMYWKQKREEGEYEVPSHFLVQSEPIKVEDGEIDISKLPIFRALPDDLWLRKVGNMSCGCTYIRTTTNRAELLCEDDSLSDSEKRYLVVGKKILFPDGTHANELPILYASTGAQLDGSIEVSDDIGAIVRQRLIDIYAGKIGKPDNANDSNAN